MTSTLCGGLPCCWASVCTLRRRTSRQPGGYRGETRLGVAFHFGHEEAADLLVAYGGGDPLPEGMEWSEAPGWGAGAVESEEDDGGLDLSTIQRFFHLWFLWFLLWLLAGSCHRGMDGGPPGSPWPGAGELAAVDHVVDNSPYDRAAVVHGRGWLLSGLRGPTPRMV